MISKRDIIIFGDDWGRHPSTIWHIGRVLAANNRVLWINALGNRKPRLRLSDLKRLAGKTRRMFFRKSSAGGNSAVIEFQPFILPFYDNRFVRAFNNEVLLRTLKRKMRRLDFTCPIVLPSTPLVADIMGRMGETSSHYICVDDYSLFDNSFRSLLEMEEKMLEKVDSCFAVSEILLESRRSKKGENHYLPQGVDTDHYGLKGEALPDEIAFIKRPVVGFFGLVSSWVNVGLVAECAKRYPGISFVIVGRSSVDLSVLERVSNIKCIGQVPYGRLPSIARIFDVGLIPFFVNDLTLACNPLKLLEYFAVGVPVVSTNLPEVRKFADLAFIAQDDEHFIGLIESALKDNTPDRNRQRQSVAQRFSWDVIVGRMSDTIEAIENRKVKFQV